MPSSSHPSSSHGTHLGGWLFAVGKRNPSTTRPLQPPQGDDTLLLPETAPELQRSEKGRRRRNLPSFKTTPQVIRILCLTLHGGLVVLHSVLIGISFPHWEHGKVVPLGFESDAWSTGLIVMSQAFATVYSAGMLVLTQQLALRRNLFAHQTLTATHDKASAWNDLGSALLTLWRQFSVTASVPGVASILIYLVCISSLHITTPALLTLETFNETIASTVISTRSIPNLTAEGIDNAFVQAAPILPLLGQFSQLFTIGLHGNTVYDVLDTNPGIGSVTVNSTTFDVSCDALPNPVAFANGTTWYIGVDQIRLSNATQPIILTPLQASIIAPNVIRMALPSHLRGSVITGGSALCYSPRGDYDGVLHPQQPELNTSPHLHLTDEGNGTLCYSVLDAPGFTLQPLSIVSDGLGTEDYVLYYSSVNFTDSGGSNGSRISLSEAMIPDTEDTRAANLSRVFSLQVMACRFSSTTQSALVDSQTRILANPPLRKTSSTWGSYRLAADPFIFKNSTVNIDMSWGTTLSAVAAVLSPNKTALCDTDCNFLTFLDKFLIDDIGIHPDIDPFFNPQPRPQLELYQLENSLENLTAALHWATTQTNPAAGAIENVVVGGNASISQPKLASRLNLNLIPLCVGLGASVILLIVAIILAWNLDDEAEAVDGTGILQLIWLLRDRPDLQKLISQVETPSVKDLRAAGMFNVRLAGREQIMAEKRPEDDYSQEPL